MAEFSWAKRGGGCPQLACRLDSGRGGDDEDENDGLVEGEDDNAAALGLYFVESSPEASKKCNKSAWRT